MSGPSADGDKPDLVVGSDGRKRCFWAHGDREYELYHDQEWGFPVSDERRLWEKLCLEGFQAGLSWLTILRKRPRFREVFCDFEAERVSRFREADVRRLLSDAGIIRHRGKIEATIANARAVLLLRQECGGLVPYLRQFVPPPQERPPVLDRATLSAMATIPSSHALSKDLKRRGFRFVGPTTCYAFMQAMGMVNDHMATCPTRKRVEAVSKRGSPWR